MHSIAVNEPVNIDTVEGWDSDGRLIYSIFKSPLPSYSGADPLEHKVLLKVSDEGMTPAKTPRAEQAGTGQPATRPESKSEGSYEPKPVIDARPRWKGFLRSSLK